MTIQDYINTLPPLSQNHARSIVLSKIKRFEKYPSEFTAREVEKITAGELEADFQDKDLGNEPEDYK